MKKYTFILEYRGGTYINQVKAKDLQEAVVKWVHSLNTSEIKDFDEEVKKNLLNEVMIDYNLPTPLNEVDSVWCMFLKVGRYNSLINIVATL